MAHVYAKSKFLLTLPCSSNETLKYITFSPLTNTIRMIDEKTWSLVERAEFGQINPAIVNDLIHTKIIDDGSSNSCTDFMFKKHEASLFDLRKDADFSETPLATSILTTSSAVGVERTVALIRSIKKQNNTSNILAQIEITDLSDNFPNQIIQAILVEHFDRIWIDFSPSDALREHDIDAYLEYEIELLMALLSSRLHFFTMRPSSSIETPNRPLDEYDDECVECSFFPICEARKKSDQRKIPCPTWKSNWQDRLAATFLIKGAKNVIL